MNDAELKQLINKPVWNVPLQAGDRVRIATHIETGIETDGLYYNRSMANCQGQIHTVTDVWNCDTRVSLEDLNWTWHPTWLERV